MTARALAVVVAALSTALGLTGFALLALTPRERVPLGSRPEETVGYVAMQIVFVGVSAVLTLRRPDNSIGWALAGVAAVSAVEFATSGYGVYGAQATNALPGSDLALWAYSWAGVLIAVFMGWIAFTFPHGRLSGRPERAGFALLALGVLLVGVSFMFRPGPLLYLPDVVNPFGVARLADALALAGIAGALSVVAGLGFALVALRRRFAAARGIERQQLKWFFGGTVAVVLVMVPVLPFTLELAGEQPLRYAARVATALATAVVPIVIGVAILRYRLYDIDLLINRTLVYGALSAILIGTYAVGVLVLQTVLRPLTGGSEFAVALSTLVVAAVFQPARGAIQRVVDRRFYRARYDATRTLDAFTARLRADVDLDSVRADLVGVLDRTVQPAHASVWLRQSE